MEENIKFVDEAIKFVAKKLNDINVDFYIVGAIGGYIDACVPLQRVHEDLDIMIEEKDIDKVKEAFLGSEYEFNDNRYDNNKVLNSFGYTDGDHEVYAQHKHSDFHIGFFLYCRDDEKYTMIEYFKDNGVCKRLERSLPINIFKYQYNEDVLYDGLKVKVSRKEMIYKNKKVMNREKDIFDVNNLEDKIDYRILEGLKGLSKLRKSKVSECGVMRHM